MSSRILSIIAARRDGQRHTPEDLEFLADGAAQGTIPDYQLAAWLMAAYLRPLDAEETAWLTQAMAESGERIDLTGLPKPWVDKHSTGGVGDKTSIVVLPLLAACGLTVVKMSGRGLGITGGTVDKLGSVPGFRLDLSPEQMKAQAARIGIAMTGQSPALAPADKVLYALRDVTATVSSIPLIVSSILSKKIAGGAETIVLDVKCGSGSFMRTLADARELGSALMDAAGRCGLQLKIEITDMSEPLGAAVGNALEVAEALSVLNPSSELSEPSRRFRRLCLELAAATLEAAGLSSGEGRAAAALETGAALRKASEWFVAQGGADPLSGAFALPVAPVIREVRASQAGYVAEIQCDAVGQAVVDLGGGRARKEDEIDPSVGIVLDACVGSRVAQGGRLFTVHAATPEAAAAAADSVLGAFRYSDGPVEFTEPVIERL